MNEFKCSICGKQHSDLTAYVNCVTKCAAAKSKENELNKMLKCVEDAFDTFNKSKEYLDLRLNEFKAKFPEEYAEYYPILMSEGEDKCEELDCDGKCNECICNKEHGCHENTEDRREDDKEMYMVFSKDGSIEAATVNGKVVDKEEALKLLSADPYLAHIAEILGDL